MVSVKDFQRDREITHRLVDLRQDPAYPELKSDIRRALRYIEKMEKLILQEQKVHFKNQES